MKILKGPMASWRARIHPGLGFPERHYADIADFVEHDDLTLGVRTIQYGHDNHIQVLLTQEVVPSDDRAVPVFMSGAVGDRSKSRPPYFSGIGMSRELGIPIISISDPQFNVDPDINLAWYTGRAHEHVQDAITQILQHLADRVGDLLFVGGSGGGFAALLFAERLGERASAFVWNPQTDLADYSWSFVAKHLASVLGDPNWIDNSQGLIKHYNKAGAREALATAEIQFRLESIQHSSSVVCLQNRHDWHATGHWKPLVERSGATWRKDGLYVTESGRHAFALSAYAKGHASAPKPVIKYVIEQMTRFTSAIDVYDALLAQHLLPNEDFAALR